MFILFRADFDIRECCSYFSALAGAAEIVERLSGFVVAIARQSKK
jgi:hypothetical protein